MMTGAQAHDLPLPCVPVLRLYIFIAKYCAKSEDLETLGRLREAQLYQDLGLMDEKERVREKIGSLALSAEKERMLAELVRQREGQKANHGKASPGASAVENARGARQTTNAQRNQFDKPADAMETSKYVKTLRPLTNQEIWVQQADLKIKEGDLVTARAMLGRSLKHCRAFEDTETEAFTLHLLARLAFLEGQVSPYIMVKAADQLRQSETPVCLKA